MNEQEKNLLLRDLCARLPYDLVGLDAFGKIRVMRLIYPTGTIIAQEIDSENCSACGFVPYLRPMSSMTEEEKKTLNNILEYQYCSDDSCMCESTDWLNAHHFDYRGLIERGLALEAPEGMYNI